MQAVKPTVIIGFGYKARRGKDTAVQAIMEGRGGEYDIRRYAFGDALREEVIEAAKDYPFDPNGWAPSPLAVAKWLCDKYRVAFDPTAHVEPGYPFTKQRALYQWWGTEYRRAKDPFYWVRKLRERIDRERPKFALITDVRFRNELSYIRSMEGYTVRVERAGYEETMTSTQTKHVSEVGLDSAPESVWTHNLITQEGDLVGAKLQAVSMFDSIVESLSFPLIDQILAQPQAFGAVHV